MYECVDYNINGNKTQDCLKNRFNFGDNQSLITSTMEISLQQAMSKLSKILPAWKHFS